MSNPHIYQLGHEPIKDHVFSPDRALMAITKANTVEIYQTSSNLAQKPKLFTTLKGHDKTVTSVDISPDGAKILTCSQDRNALVWEYDHASSEYKPTLVLLRINRAATVCKWSPDGTKFAVGSSDRIIAVCYYEAENDWWVSKHLKKPLKSTITSLSWHPNNVLLAAGSTDGHARVFSAYIKGLDAKPEPTVWGSKLPFQTLCGDFINETGAWIHDVAFSPDGNSLGFVSHDASLGIVYPEGEGLPPKAILNVRTSYLSLKSLVFLTNSKIVVGGHNCNLIVFEGDEHNWQESYKIESQKDLIKDVPENQDDDEEISSHQALNMFKQMDLKGRVNKPSTGANKALSTIHQNTISSIKLFSNSQVSTSGIDGKVVIFNV
ncbi:actin-related protein 2/3 complex, subunit 1 [Suhomyces tanzawaensis NRRL Y-17324]|uniref:Actin-related protein 2/3 complex subunit n=1 Tax=Suhomyces tanzawaensis NRRL Y-17324 TaxID=984487 RepID=A0A1E4SP40_9ASCO|nr:actin-related protein 2/3 complex, subunit 1 [Suhomyces tanzawaensis NRRL Y-17324]ODV81265.1 actin-related protein 2/3 complex, subunit 1 [Suhomyces tanzawaensis NRRL Y-17324]